MPGRASRSTTTIWKGFDDCSVFECLLRHLLLLLLTRSISTDAYCWQPGWNPYVKWAPSVRQVSLERVRVSWNSSYIDKLHCADQFVVKYWRSLEPGSFEQTDLLPIHQFSVEVDVRPLSQYAFQLIAREDKGFPFGVDYNKGPLARMATVRNPQVEIEDDHHQDHKEMEESIVRSSVRRSEVFEIVGFFTMVVVVVLLLALLALMLVPLFRACRPLNGDQEAEEPQVDDEQT